MGADRRTGRCYREAMVLGTHSIPIWKSESADDGTPRLFLADALEEFSKSRATRRLIREGLARDIRSALQVPLAYEVYVRPGDLGRAVRKVMRAALDVSTSGECFVIDLGFGPDSLLSVTATRTPELPVFQTGTWRR